MSAHPVPADSNTVPVDWLHAVLPERLERGDGRAHLFIAGDINPQYVRRRNWRWLGLRKRVVEVYPLREYIQRMGLQNGAAVEVKSQVHQGDTGNIGIEAVFTKLVPKLTQ